jgi:hypothetical protein
MRVKTNPLKERIARAKKAITPNDVLDFTKLNMPQYREVYTCNSDMVIGVAIQEYSDPVEPPKH